MRNYTYQKLGMALIFALVLAIILPSAAGAEITGTTEGGFEYTIEGETAVINRYTGSEAEVLIPKQIQGIPVTRIRNAAFVRNTKLISVTIPYGVTVLGHNVFNECTNLKSVDLPESLIRIGQFAFYGCSSLTNIEIPNGITSISTHTFYLCTSLTDVVIPSSVKYIENYAFALCDSLVSIEIPDSVEKIAPAAFYKTPYNLTAHDFERLDNSFDVFSHSDLTMMDEDKRSTIDSAKIEVEALANKKYRIDQEYSVRHQYDPEIARLVDNYQFTIEPKSNLTFVYNGDQYQYEVQYDWKGDDSDDAFYWGQLFGNGGTVFNNDYTKSNETINYTLSNELELINKSSEEFVFLIGNTQYDIMHLQFSLLCPGNVDNYEILFSLDGVKFSSELEHLTYVIERDSVIVGEYGAKLKPNSGLYFLVFKRAGTEKYAKMADDIYAAGSDHDWEKSDTWSKEQQESYWDILTAKWKADIQSIIDTVYTEFASIGPDIIGFTAEEIAANEGLKTAFGMPLWGLGEVADKVLTTAPSGKTFDLSKEEYPTLDDYFTEVVVKFGDVKAYDAACPSPNGVDIYGVTKEAFISEWAPKDDSMGDQGVQNGDSTEKEPEQFSEEAYQELSIGGSGQAVLDMKQRFFELGYFRTTSFNNRFTDNTADTVKLFEKNNSLPVDGVADAEMLSVLFSDSAVGK